MQHTKIFNVDICFKYLTFLHYLKFRYFYLILIDGEEDKSIRIEGLDLHGDGQVPGVIVSNVPLHRIPGTVERVARMFNYLSRLCGKSQLKLHLLMGVMKRAACS